MIAECILGPVTMTRYAALALGLLLLLQDGAAVQTEALSQSGACDDTS